MSPPTPSPPSRPETLGRILAAAVMLVPMACGGGGETAAPSQAHLQAYPAHVEVTSAQKVQLGFKLSGTSYQKVHWQLQEQDAGHITEGGLYTAALHAGTYHAVVQSLHSAQARDQVEIKVHPRPEAVSLMPDHVQIRRGAAVTLIPAFTDGPGIKGAIYPGGVEAASGAAVRFTPQHDTTYTLRVTNALGVADEKKATVHVDAAAASTLVPE